MASGPLEERRREGGGHLEVQMIQHFPSRGLKNRIRNFGPRLQSLGWHILSEGQRGGHLSKMGRNVSTER